MPQRRLFNAQYGVTKTQVAKGRAKIPPPQGSEPVPLSIETQAALPNEHGQAPAPAMGQAQGQGQLPPHLESLLQQLLARYGGTSA